MTRETCAAETLAGGPDGPEACGERAIGYDSDELPLCRHHAARAVERETVTSIETGAELALDDEGDFYEVRR